ncbi:Uncharacterised protein [Budvicia aquatica]|uniref:Uncharacterized protein n=1 Tax=Budvicia aquatica TaxID=82979 RepID=A0A484ZBN9_9GAMM|nr:Uncharacterised protein [Budvicia aquatica]
MLYTPYAYLRSERTLPLNKVFYLYRDIPDSITSNVKESNIHNVVFSVQKMINYIKKTVQGDSQYLKN